MKSLANIVILGFFAISINITVKELSRISINKVKKSRIMLVLKAKNQYKKRLEQIKKSTVVVKTENGTGSGTLIYDKSFGKAILTNAHVCVPQLKNESPENIEKYNEKEKTVLIGYEKAFYSMRIRNKKIIRDFYLDYCFIPISERVSKDLTFVKFKYRPLLRAEELSEKEKRIVFSIKGDYDFFMATKNYSFEKTSIASGFFLADSNNSLISLKYSENTTREVFRGRSTITNISVVPGDSGSSIYNKNLEMIGLVFGNKITTQLTKEEEKEIALAGRNDSRVYGLVYKF